MKKTSLWSLLILALGLIVLSACGGDSSSASLPVQIQPTKAVIKIETTGTLGGGTMIGGITVTGVLPAGVTVKATPDPENPAVLVTNSGVVVESGAAVAVATGESASAIATYNSTDRKVNIQVYDQDGFGIGEFVTVTCNIASGTTPKAASFGLEGFTPKDLNGAPINGLTPGYTVDIH